MYTEQGAHYGKSLAQCYNACFFLPLQGAGKAAFGSMYMECTRGLRQNCMEVWGITCLLAEDAALLASRSRFCMICWLGLPSRSQSSLGACMTLEWQATLLFEASSTLSGSIYLSIDLSIYRWIYPSTYLSICLSVCLSVHHKQRQFLTCAAPWKRLLKCAIKLPSL